MARTLIESREVVNWPALSLANRKGDILLDTVQRLTSEVRLAAEAIGEFGWPTITISVEIEADDDETEGPEAA